MNMPGDHPEGSSPSAKWPLRTASTPKITGGQRIDLFGAGSTNTAAKSEYLVCIDGDALLDRDLAAAYVEPCCTTHVWVP